MNIQRDRTILDDSSRVRAHPLFPGSHLVLRPRLPLQTLILRPGQPDEGIDHHSEDTQLQHDRHAIRRDILAA